MITAATLESEWLGNLGRRTRRTVREVAGEALLAVNSGPDETFFAALGVASHQVIVRHLLRRHYPPLRLFVWRQAVVATHPAWHAPLLAALDGQLPGKPAEVARIRSDLAFLQLITDQFAEEGFLSVALHLVQKVHGEIPRRPGNLEFAVSLSAWLDERYQEDLERLGRAEIKPG
ncbi:MAG: hypothetical protein HQL96_09435 [Magnetococcales bacterium]|nr:hypothetical protein [Magnetococcales bacterium]